MTGIDRDGGAGQAKGLALEALLRSLQKLLPGPLQALVEPIVVAWEQAEKAQDAAQRDRRHGEVVGALAKLAQQISDMGTQLSEAQDIIEGAVRLQAESVIAEVRDTRVEIAEGLERVLLAVSDIRHRQITRERQTTLFTPIEVHLQRHKVLEPRLVRRQGPLWWDFEAGYVYRRPEVDEILESLDSPDGAAWLLEGSAATGKSVIARHVGYECAKAGRPVFWTDGPGAATYAADVLEEVEGLSAEGEQPLFVIEDLHRDWDRCDALADALSPLQSRAGFHLLCTAHPPSGGCRPTLPSTSEAIDQIREAGRAKGLNEACWQVAREVVRNHFAHHPQIGEPTQDEVELLVEVEPANLLVLSYLLEAFRPGEPTDRSQAVGKVAEELAALTSRHFPFETSPDLPRGTLLTIAAFFQYEIPIEEDLVVERLGEGARAVAARLCEAGELVSQPGDLLALPHAVLADLYLEAAEARNWIDDGVSFSADLFAHALQGPHDPNDALVARCVASPNLVRGCLLMRERESFRDAAVAAFSAALRADLAHTRATAAIKLGWIADAGASNALYDALADEESAVRLLSALALCMMRDDTGMAYLVQGLCSPEPAERLIAARALPKGSELLLADRGEWAVERLIGALRDREPDVRQAAARALGFMGDARAIAPLREALDDADSSVRAQAALALGSIGEPQGARLLTAALSKFDPGLRKAAVDALGSLRYEPAAQALSEVLRTDADVAVRAAAALALGRLRRPLSAETLLEALQDSDPRVRGAAAWALGSRRHRPASDALIEALQDEDDDVRRAAAEALVRLRTRPRLARRVLREFRGKKGA